MILYEVTIQVDNDIGAAWEKWMIHEHIPRVLGTRCFVSCKMYRPLESSVSTHLTYVLQFSAIDMYKYEEYRDSFAPRLKQEGPDLFPGKTVATRRLLQEISQ